MDTIPSDYEGFKAVGAVARRILQHAIANCDNNGERKTFILTGYESGYFSAAETFAMFAAYGVRDA